jgi:acylphosphatase
MHTIHLIVAGKVQGVYYRVSAREAARQLGITGWVRNRPDSSVEILATGEPAQLEAFVAWCKKGPAGAIVYQLTREERPLQLFDGFTIAR